ISFNDTFSFTKTHYHFGDLPGPDVVLCRGAPHDPHRYLSQAERADDLRDRAIRRDVRPTDGRVLCYPNGRSIPLYQWDKIDRKQEYPGADHAQAELLR